MAQETTQVTGTIKLPNGSMAAYKHVLFTPLPQSFPKASQPNMYLDVPIPVTCDANGSIGILTFVPGYWQVDVLAEPVWSFTILVPAVNDGAIQFIGDIITNIVPDQNAPQSGQGSPEGVFAASPGFYYWDSLNKTQYVKDSGTGVTGWIPLAQQIAQ